MTAPSRPRGRRPRPPSLLVAVLLLAPFLAGAAVARAGEASLEDLLGSWAIVARRADERGREEQAAVLARISALGSPAAQKALEALRDEYAPRDWRLGTLILTAWFRHASPEEVDRGVRWVEAQRDPRLREGFGEALGAVQEPATRRHLRGALLARSPPPIKALLARGIGYTKDPEAVPALLLLLRETHADVRIEAVDALGRIGDGRAATPLAIFLRDADPRIRDAAARALGRLGARRVIGPLVEALGDEDARVVESAAEALGRLEAREALPALIARLGTLQETDLRVADAVAGALQAITGRVFGVDAVSWKGWWESVRDTGWEKVQLRRDGDTVPARRYYGFEIRSSKLVFVLDVSRSMGWNERLEIAKAELVRVLHELPPSTRFNIVTYSDRAEAWQSGLREATPTFVRRAVAFVEGRQEDNGTNTYDALRTAFADPEVDTIFFLSDGNPSVGAVIDPDLILSEVRTWNRHRRVRIHCVALIKGDPPPGWAAMEDRSRASAFMRELAEENDGALEVVK